MDIQLSDGLSFNIFKACKITCPVIFTTAYDKYLTQAFEYSSIDYLLKPISQDKLRNAIKKYKALQTHFVNNHSHAPESFGNHDKKRSRILVKKGMKFQPIRVKNTRYFFTHPKLVFLLHTAHPNPLPPQTN